MKTITSNARGNDQLSMFHLFEFTLKNLDGTPHEILRFTDLDIFLLDGALEYTPLSITFDRLTEDISMATNSITITLDNVNEALSRAALAYEWRQNSCTITRVMYRPNEETPSDGVTYEYGYGNNLSPAGYPQLVLDDVLLKDRYTLFAGHIGSFSATEQTLTGTITTKFIQWQNPFPSRRFDQQEFTTIIDTMNTQLYWGTVDDETTTP